MLNITIKKILTIGLTTFAATHANATEYTCSAYENAKITFVVPYKAGGGYDTYAFVGVARQRYLQ